MNSINKNGCSVCDTKERIVIHEFIMNSSYDCYWDATILKNSTKYFVRITENISTNGRKYYIGELSSDYIAEKFINTYLVFGFSNYYDTYRYILEAMLRVINGDYSEIEGVGHCTAAPNDKRKLN